jgi:hypothetical protein
MGLVYATQDANDTELKLFRAVLSTYRDGSGAERESDGSTRANWRQIERCVANLVNSNTNEDKNIFDVTAVDQCVPDTYYGYSVKSKQLSKTAFASLSAEGRVYMEIANSPAKFWDDIKEQHGFTESTFRENLEPQKIGETLIQSVIKWHREGKEAFENANPGMSLDLNSSNYFCLSYSKQTDPNLKEYQVHIFPLDYPENVRWKYHSKKCLRGFDPNEPDKAILDWYGMSGGQLKYYPKARHSRYASPIFKLLSPPQISIIEKARSYFPKQFG